MMRSTLLTALLTCTLLAGCQSARFSPTLPRVSEYGTASSQPAKLTNEPILSAAVPGSAPDLATNSKARPMLEADNERRIPQPALPLALPDTALDRLLRPAPVIPADPLTTVVNIGGGAMATAGLVVMVASTLADDRSSSVGGTGRTAEVLGGLVLLLAGAALLFFQGENGRLRKIREARRQANESATVASAPPTARAPFRSGLRKIARILIVVGGALLLLGLMVPYGIFLTALPALALMIVGVFMLVFSI